MAVPLFDARQLVTDANAGYARGFQQNQLRRDDVAQELAMANLLQAVDRKQRYEDAFRAAIETGQDPGLFIRQVPDAALSQAGQALYEQRAPFDVNQAVALAQLTGDTSGLSQHLSRLTGQDTAVALRPALDEDGTFLGRYDYEVNGRVIPEDVFNRTLYGSTDPNILFGLNTEQAQQRRADNLTAEERAFINKYQEGQADISQRALDAFYLRQDMAAEEAARASEVAPVGTGGPPAPQGPVFNPLAPPQVRYSDVYDPFRRGYPESPYEPPAGVPDYTDPFRLGFPSASQPQSRRVGPRGTISLDAIPQTAGTLPGGRSVTPVSDALMDFFNRARQPNRDPNRRLNERLPPFAGL